VCLVQDVPDSNAQGLVELEKGDDRGLAGAWHIWRGLCIRKPRQRLSAGSTWTGWVGVVVVPRAIHEAEQWGESCLTPTPGSLVVKSVGPVTEKLLVQIPELKNMFHVPLSKALNPNCSCKSL
jgi:hypothetical protein